MSKNISNFFSEFGKYSLEKYVKNTKYKSKIDELMRNRNIFYSNKQHNSDTISDKILTDCNFLEDEKITRVIKEQIQLILLNTKLSKEEIYDKLNRQIDQIKIINYLTTNPSNIKIKEYVLNGIYSYSRLQNPSLHMDDLTIGHLRKFCDEVIYADYFQTHFSGFINTTYEKSDAEKFAQHITEWMNRNKTFIGETDNGIKFSNELFPYSFLAINKTYGVKLNLGSNKFVISETDTDFESTYGFNIPNIRIFCSGPISRTNYIQYSFNRFTFFHEMGHSMLMKKMNVNININGEKYNLTIGNDIFTNINSLLGFDSEQNEIFNNNAKLGFEQLLGTDVNGNAVLDIIADMLATFSMVKELKVLGITDEEIFKIMISIYSRLSGDELHFKSSLRSLLNIYISDILRKHYDKIILEGGETQYIDEKYIGVDRMELNQTVEQIIGLANKINKDKFKSMVSAFKDKELAEAISKIDPSLTGGKLIMAKNTIKNKINGKYINLLSGIDNLIDKAIVEDIVLEYIRDKKTIIQVIIKALEYF